MLTRRHRGLAALCLMLVAGGWLAGANPEPQRSTSANPRLRQPVALALADNGATLLVANHRSGSLCVVDLESAECTGEFEAAKSLADIAVLAPGRVLAVDEGRHELLGLRRVAGRLEVESRLSVSESPVSLAIAADGMRCSVASLWSRMITVVEPGVEDGGDKPALRVVHEVSLPFAPREQQLLPDGRRVLIADAFGGHLALVDLERGELESVREVPGHNIRGLALSTDGRHLLVSHQGLNRLARTDEDDIHWGLVVSGSLRVLSLDAVTDPGADILKGSWSVPLGDVGHGAGDPGQIAPVDDHHVLVAAGGTGEVLDVDLRGPIRRIHVGGRPIAIVLSADRSSAYVADAFSDSVSVVTPDRKGLEIPLGDMPKLSSADRGERLFYDAGLSHGGWFSCHSCHTDGHTNGNLADTLGDGSFGSPKAVLPLGGVAETAPWGWTGRITRLEDQIEKSVQTTMHGQPLSDEQTADLAAFLKTLRPPPRLKHHLEQDAVERGRGLFGSLRCDTCHVPPTYSSSESYDVGLTDEAGQRRFNPPSLLGVGQRRGYFHDLRASSLRDAIAVHRHQVSRELSPHELSDLVEFLRSL
ncbi:MAG: cytochrome C peroxidase [Planctomycetes bacterium]|nr:cytochrome C peroxidase [Planctomycetota bacterium]